MAEKKQEKEETPLLGVVSLGIKLGAQKNAWLTQQLLTGLEKIGVYCVLIEQEPLKSKDNMQVEFISKLEMTNRANGEKHTAELNQKVNYDKPNL